MGAKDSGRPGERYGRPQGSRAALPAGGLAGRPPPMTRPAGRGSPSPSSHPRGSRQSAPSRPAVASAGRTGPGTSRASRSGPAGRTRNASAARTTLPGPDEIGSAPADARTASTSRSNAGSAQASSTRADAPRSAAGREARPAPTPVGRRRWCRTLAAVRWEEHSGRPRSVDRPLVVRRGPPQRSRPVRPSVDRHDRQVVASNVNAPLAGTVNVPSSRPGTMTWLRDASVVPRRVERPTTAIERFLIGGWRHRHARLRRPAGRRLRLHQRLPRHGERDRHVRRDARPVAAAGRSSWRPPSTSSARSPGRPSPTPSASGLVDEQTTTQAIVAAALIGAIAWNLITWQLGLPSSSSHALIGGLLGATIIAAGSAPSTSTGSSTRS